MKVFNDRMYIEKTTFGKSLESWAKDYKNSIAIIEGKNHITYETFNNKVDQLAAGFKGMGLEKGQHVVVQLPNRSSFIFTCFALFKLGVIPILVRPAHREADLKHIFELCEPVAYIVADRHMGFSYEKMTKKIFEQYDFLKYVFVDGDSNCFKNLNDLSGDDFNFNAPDYMDMALITLSGGTTGKPKLIPRSHGDYIYNVKMAAKRSEMNASTIFLAALSISHGFAFANPGILGTFFCGGTVVLTSNASPDEILPLIEQERVTMTSLVPAAAQFCLETLSWDDSNDISSLETILIGGSVLEESLARRIIKQMDCKLQQVFGMSEGLICMTNLDDPEEVVVTCQGRPISEYDEIKIVDEFLEPVKDGIFGELVTRGPYTIHGYYKAEEANKKSFTKDGFYRTGDRAKLIKDGNVVVAGRIKDRINRGGEKIMPSEVESYLLRHVDIKDSAVVGVPDEVLGQSIFSFIMTDNKELSLIQLNEFLISEGVSTYKLPDNMAVIESWPLTNVGKIDKNELQRMAVEVIKL
ncbi:MAG: AMP-binding protein [Fusobacteriaceae bacterium]|nr:AMP-binding protein [Fusobacteriaceae bacterium]